MSTPPGPVLEIFTFLASAALLKDETVIHPAFEQIRTRKGLQHVYEGTGIEEPNRRWLILVWETYEHHKSLMEDEIYPEVLKNLGKCLGGEEDMSHVLFSDNTRIALTSPVTEIANILLNEDTDKAEFEKIMNEFMHHGHLVPRAKEHAPFVFGESREKPRNYFFVGGWTSKQHHLDCVVDPEGIKPDVDKLGKVATFKVHHLTVKEYGLRRD